MNQYNQGRVIRMSFGGVVDPSSERMLSRVLAEMDGVEAFTIDTTERVLTAFVESDVADELDLVKALVASGMIAQGLVGPTLASGGELGAC